MTHKDDPPPIPNLPNITSHIEILQSPIPERRSYNLPARAELDHIRIGREEVEDGSVVDEYEAEGVGLVAF